jgi:hypothetical protein
MDMEKNNIVIGLPDIIEKYFFLFNESLQLCREEFEDSRHQLTNIVSDTCLPKIISLNDYPMDVEASTLSATIDGHNPRFNDNKPFPDIYPVKEEELFIPWGDSVEESCPEDDETPVPCRFSGPLMYLAVSHLVAVNEYKKYIETHVAEAMSKAVPDLVKYLLSDKCISVFVPQDWNGIKGIKPIEFEVLPNMPTSYKPKVKPINGQLFKDVKTELAYEDLLL